MNRFKLLVATLIMLTSTLYASDGDNYLNTLTETIEQMGSYEVKFSIVVGEESIDGSYSVDDGKGINSKKPEPSYTFDAGTQRIYGNETERRIYDSSNKECVIENVDNSTPMMMTNPSKAFTSLDKQFSSKVVEQNENSITLELSPREEESLFESVTMTISATDKLPQSIIYKADGDELSITIRSFERRDSKLIQSIPNAVDLSEYKIIDLR